MIVSCARPAKSLALAIALPALACARSAADPPPGPLGSALIAFAADIGASPSAIADAWQDLRQFADRVERRNRRTHSQGIDDLNAVLFGELGFAREITSNDPRFFQLQSVIAMRRGSCLGLSALYLTLAERLGIPLDGILLPGHFFVRTRGAHPRNIELLRQGEAMPDAWYEKKYGPWPAESSTYFRPLTIGELVAVHWYNAGNHQRDHKPDRAPNLEELGAAETDYMKAVAAFPTLAEAHASLGAVRQLRGALTEAEESYREAARERADLPGLQHNMALLKREQQLTSHPTRMNAP